MLAYRTYLIFVLVTVCCSSSDATSEDKPSGIDCIADDVCYKECARDPDCKSESSGSAVNPWDSTDESDSGSINPACTDGGLSADITIVDDNMSAIAGCQSINGSLSLERTSLVSLEALDEIKSINGALIIRDNAALESLSGLDNLEFVGGDLSIDNNPLLVDTTGLASLTSVGGDLVVRSNGSLENLAGLNQLESVGDDVYIRGNPKLTSLRDLAALEHVSGDLRIGQNLALPTCEAGGTDNSLINRVYIPGDIMICENLKDNCDFFSCPEDW